MSVTTKKKHVERELFEDFSLPEDNQSIVRIVRPRGNNLHQVAAPNGEEFLVSMPPKFRKHVWIKRGNYVVTEPIPEGNKVRAEIVRILMKDHIRYIEQNGKWPFALQYSEAKDESDTIDKLERLKEKDFSNSETDSESDTDDSLIENPNRPNLYVSSDETESSDSEENESDSGSEEEDSELDDDDDDTKSK